jgi:hypothetical protein
MMPDPKRQKTDWLTVVREAAWLWLIMEQGRQKRDFDDAIIAIDPSVIMLFADASGERNVSPSVFNSMDRSIGPDLSFVIGGVTKDASLRRSFLLHGHDAEFQGIYRAMLQGATNRRMSEAALYSKSDKLQKGDDLEDFLKLTLVRDRFRSSEAKFTLLCEFIRDTRLYTPEKMVGHLEIADIGPTDDEMTSLVDLWFDALRKRKSKNIAPHRIFSDALALAHLHLLNENRRDADTPIYLVTADPHIHGVGLDFDLPGYQYVVDPRYLLFRNELEIDHRVANSFDGYGLEDWLRVLLSPFSKSGRLTVKAVWALYSQLDLMVGNERQVNASLQDAFGRLHGDAVDAFPAHLQRFVRLNLNALSREIFKNHEFFANLGELIFNNMSENAETVLRRWQISVLTDVTSTALVTSLVTTLVSTKNVEKGKSTMNSRMPLAIRYKTDRDGVAFQKALEKAVISGSINEVVGGSSLREKYTIQLISCQLHAKFGDWQAAESLSRMAILLSELSNGDEPIRGHEAYYANAVCQRHLMKRPSDIDSIAASLNEASKRWSARFPDQNDPRFSLESISLELGRRYMNRYFVNEGWDDKQLGHSTKTPGELVAELSRLLTTLRAAETKTPWDEMFSLSMIKQCAINGMSAICLLALDGDIEPSSMADSREFEDFYQSLEYLDRQFTKGSNPERMLSTDYFHFNLELARAFRLKADVQRSAGMARLTHWADLVQERCELRYDANKTKEILKLLA